MTKKRVKQLFKQHKVQCGPKALDLVMYELETSVNRMAKRCANGNLKRLTIDTMWVALDKYSPNL